MTIKDAIRRIRNHMDVHRIGQYPHILIGEAFNMAITALQEKAEREDLKPLTIEELRKMNGEPVWVEELSKLTDQTGWALVEVDDRGTYKDVPYVKCHICTWDVSFRGLHCYRHKPRMDPDPKIEVMEQYYVVTKNDFPYGYKRIADRCGVSEGDLLKVNGLSWDTPLYPGQHLWIPKPKEEK